MDTRINGHGYEVLTKHTRSRCEIRFHVLVAEKALGKPLPKGAVVHHVNEIKTDNRPSNLVICPNNTYHNFIHQRMKAKQACGNVNWRLCWICGDYDDPANLNYVALSTEYRHHKCWKSYSREWQRKRKKAVNKQEIL